MAWSASRSRTRRAGSKDTTSIFAKHVLEFDDVVNKRREVIYEERRRISEPTLRDNVWMVGSQIERLVQSFAVAEEPEDRDLAGLYGGMTAIFPLPDYMTVDHGSR